MKKEFNADIAGSVSEFETLIKKVLPRNIMYKVLLGKGLEFDGYRNFTQSDDASLIDWKATVRSGKTLVKKYIEERDLKFIFIIDMSENMVFGSTEKLKCEYIAEMAAALSHLILLNGDRIGFVLYNDQGVIVRPPKMGNKQFEIFVHEVTNPENYKGRSNLKPVINDLIKTLDPSVSMIFLISDFVKVDESYRKTLQTIANLFEVAAIVVRDPLDLTMPEINKEIVIQDPETEEKILINPKIAKKIYEKNSKEQLNNLKQMFKDNNIDFAEFITNQRFTLGLAEFLKTRIIGGRIVKKQNVY